MKIGLDLRMLGNRHGGIGRYCFQLAKNILAIDTENEYTLFFNTALSAAEDINYFQNNFKVKIIETKIRHYSLGEQIGFLRLLNNCNMDLVHFPNFNVPVLYKKPYVVTIHDLVHHKIGGAKKSHFFHFLAYKKVIGQAARNAKAIITVSEYSKADISNILQVPGEKIVVAYEGTSLETNVSREKLENVKDKFLLTRPYFLFVGVLERKKNIKNLTRGFDALIKKYKVDFDLVLVGPKDSNYPDIKYKAMDIKHRDRLVFTDFLPDSDLAALYKGAHAFVSSSLHEGFGLPGVEAMQFGLPLAVSNIAVFNEIYDEAAIYFNPLDPEDIAEKMYLLAHDSQYCKILREKSLRRSSLFNWRQTAQKTLDVYKSVVA